MLRRILNLYRFTQSEKRSLILLLFFLLVINLFGFILRKDSNLIIPSTPTLQTISSVGIYTETEEPSQAKSVIQKPAKKEIIKLIDINSADSISFLSLYGIGPVFAGRIVKYRNLLGGFHQCKQLLEVYGMDSVRYNGFSSNIRCDKKGLKHIDVNTAGFKDLLRHPYLDYDNVRQLVNFRDKHGPIVSPETLWQDSVLPVELKPKLLPYIDAG